MPGAASCQRAAARQGRPVQPGGSDVAAGRVTLPALCSYQCETGLGRRLSVPPPPAGSGGCAGAPGAQGRGRGGRGGFPPRPVPGLLRPVTLHRCKSCANVTPCAPQGCGLPEGSVNSRCVYIRDGHFYMCAPLYMGPSVQKERFCRGLALQADPAPVQRSAGRAAGSSGGRAGSPGDESCGTAAPGQGALRAVTRVCACSCPRIL